MEKEVLLNKIGQIMSFSTNIFKKKWISLWKI